MSNLIPHLISDTTPAAPGTVVSSTVAGSLDKFDNAIDVTCVRRGATGGTLDIYLQKCLDLNGTVWADIGHYAQLANGASPISDTLRFIRAFQIATPVVIGVGTTAAPGVALAVNTFVTGDFGDRIRAVYVAGAGTTVGAAIQIYIVGVRDS